ncbi:hypothetical protein [Mucilaginibacter rubeus]|nr:hypothetical protein [Mucilaginibacter rubeus]QTE41519.1 hypothetical protein J3L19_21560 [Mucilaginibacter rubeus]QTE48125.1 hypothetical protein J3L21_21560 [Mucilaginibacter rubeus]QTE59516.1 hypothetical protein J3L23_13205 [Mucilaginibacter rubeus]QTE61024.1 hypothetical protein J3L22_20645 [Mucilaginibacter rubeus]QTF59785.1 hypothetical protein J3L20_20295 [Mucilaginibacter rubeus]
MYLNERKKLQDLCVNDHNDELLTNHSFNFVSAHLSNFIPHLKVSEHAQIFQEILFHQKLSWLDIQFENIPDLVSVNGLTNSLLSQIKTKPAVLCTFHLGSIRLLNLMLGHYGIKFALILSEAAIAEYQDIYLEIYKKHNCYGANGSFTIISAQSPSAALQMLKAVKRGESLLLYVDGNTGTGKTNLTNERLLKVNFLAESIHARTGAAYIAHLANIPLITAASFRNSLDDIQIKFFEPMCPDSEPDREEFISKAIRLTYEQLSNLVQCYPGQWETWLSLHRFIKPELFNQPEKRYDKIAHKKFYSFNLDKFGLFMVDLKCYLFDKRKYQGIEISNELYHTLKSCINAKINRSEIEANIIDQLTQKGVLA